MTQPAAPRSRARTVWQNQSPGRPTERRPGAQTTLAHPVEGLTQMKPDTPTRPGTSDKRSAPARCVGAPWKDESASVIRVNSRRPEPTGRQPLTASEAERIIADSCFDPSDNARIGIELEFVVATGDPLRRTGGAAPSSREGVVGVGGVGLDGSLSVEPGGQLELSSRPHVGLPDLIDAVRSDLKVLHRRAREAGLTLLGLGVDPLREPRCVTREPRYTAMQKYFAPWGSTGATMMCSTAGLQVNVDAGHDQAEVGHRWELLYAVGPTLAAAFANSSWRCGGPTRWKSARLATWLSLDPSRTGVPWRAVDETASRGFARWALDARVMMIRQAGDAWVVPEELTFRRWLSEGYACGGGRVRPTVADLRYHLSTLFPHVRPRGYFEVRYIDAQPGDWWIVPTVVVGALAADRGAAEAAKAACEQAGTGWDDAAKRGLENPATAAAALRVLEFAADSLRRDPRTKALGGHVERYIDRWTVRARSPADDPPSAWNTQLEGLG
jgi:glutamate--cysteine ligase